jgi:DeoR/GlpR family transcriptional regulator of sugar metabolism
MAVLTRLPSAIARVRADTHFMGVTGIHPEFGLTTGDPEEAAIKRVLSRQACWPPVKNSGPPPPFFILPLSEVDALVIGQGLPDELVEPYRRIGITMIDA